MKIKTIYNASIIKETGRAAMQNLHTITNYPKAEKFLMNATNQDLVEAYKKIFNKKIRYSEDYCQFEGLFLGNNTQPQDRHEVESDILNYLVNQEES